MAKPTVWSAWLSISRCLTNPAQVGMDVFGVQQLGGFGITLGQQCATISAGEWWKPPSAGWF
ncbi:hypothetical protein ASD99_14845 [Mesorhizobium sp. Root695]|nr:hypothetical protein ASD99_14845 [Mesorhizobium sp. Root695]